MPEFNWDQFGGIHGPEMDRVMQGDALGIPPKGATGGEWDTYKRTPQRTLRSLRGAGFLRQGGLEPDVAATHRIGPGTGHDDTDSAVEWYMRTAQGALTERRRTARRDRDQKRASSEGYKTPYQQRSFQAILEGHDSYGAKRKAHGWQ